MLTELIANNIDLFKPKEIITVHNNNNCSIQRWIIPQREACNNNKHENI